VQPAFKWDDTLFMVLDSHWVHKSSLHAVLPLIQSISNVVDSTSINTSEDNEERLSLIGRKIHIVAGKQQPFFCLDSSSG
jgi:hypothetical protein